MFSRHIKPKRSWYVLAVLLFLIGAWSLLLYHFRPNEIVASLGTSQGYILVFVAAFIGGTSIIFPFPYYLLVFTLGAGGLNPFFLGFAAGLGLLLGDSTSYYIGYQGRSIVPKRIKHIIDRTRYKLRASPAFVFPSVLFCYAAFVPLPNDFVILSLSLAHYPYWKVMIPLTLGNILFNILVAFAGLYGFHLIF